MRERNLSSAPSWSAFGSRVLQHCRLSVDLILDHIWHTLLPRADSIQTHLWSLDGLCNGPRYRDTFLSLFTAMTCHGQLGGRSASEIGQNATTATSDDRVMAQLRSIPGEADFNR